MSVWSTLRAHDAHAPCRRSAREGERPTAARSTCASRVLTELRARAARKASARRRVRRYPAAHDPRRHWQCRHWRRRAVRSPVSQPASYGVWEVERSPRRAAQPLGHRSPATVRAVAHWRQPCIGTAPRLASAASAVALSSARRWLAGAAPALRDRPDASSGVPEPWSLARGVRDGRFACHTGAAVRGSEAGASADASQQARAGVACTSRRALYPYVRRPSRPPYPWLAVPVRAP